MSKLWAVLSAIGVAILGMLSIFLSGVRKGKEGERVKNLDKIVEQVNAVKKNSDKIDASSVDDIRKRLHDEYAKR